MPYCSIIALQKHTARRHNLLPGLLAHPANTLGALVNLRFRARIQRHPSPGKGGVGPFPAYRIYFLPPEYIVFFVIAFLFTHVPFSHAHLPVHLYCPWLTTHVAAILGHFLCPSRAPCTSSILF